MKPEWKIFSEQYVIDWNGTRSYMVAYPKSSYDNARSEQSNLLAKPCIAEYIEEIQKDLAKLAGVSALRNLIELKKLAYTNLSDFKDGWLTQKDFEELDQDTLAALSEIQYTTKTIGQTVENIVKFKLHDKQRAIEAINKMLGYDAPVKSEQTIKDESFTPEKKKDLDELVERYKKSKK